MDAPPYAVKNPIIQMPFNCTGVTETESVKAYN
jgi:hypothetical protein